MLWPKCRRRVGRLANEATTDLEQRLKALEDRPSLMYHGPWLEGVNYKAGAAVTWSGSMWIARESTRAKPGQSSPESRAWTLAVKKGADAK